MYIIIWNGHLHLYSCSNETERKFQSQHEQHVLELEKLQNENKITQKEYQDKILEANNNMMDKMQKLQDEIGRMQETAISVAADAKGFFATLGADLDSMFGFNINMASPLINAAFDFFKPQE